MNIVLTAATGSILEEFATGVIIAACCYLTSRGIRNPLRIKRK